MYVLKKLFVNILYVYTSFFVLQFAYVLGKATVFPDYGLILENIVISENNGLPSRTSKPMKIQH